jgi:hypothetical protein
MSGTHLLKNASRPCLCLNLNNYTPGAMIWARNLFIHDAAKRRTVAHFCLSSRLARSRHVFGTKK